MNFWKFVATLTLAVAYCPGASGDALKASIQFWGDTFVSWQMTQKYREKTGTYTIFRPVQSEIDKALINVINFEGVATGTHFPLVPKRFLLSMPLFVDRVLVEANLRVATLANNHAMDFGRAGLLDSMATLLRSGIRMVGAGMTAHEANQPLILDVAEGSICILNYSRTLPSEHWARGLNAGTANLNFTRTAERIATCAAKHKFTFVVFHWGAEMTRKVKEYQTKLARLAIDNGATAVIGHHPHVLQPIEIYRGKPIIYSLGNFAFASNPNSHSHQGMGARFYFDEDKISAMELLPIRVTFAQVKGQPQLFAEDTETTFLDSFIPSTHCSFKGAHGMRRCDLD